MDTTLPTVFRPFSGWLPLMAGSLSWLAAPGWLSWLAVSGLCSQILQLSKLIKTCAPESDPGSGRLNKNAVRAFRKRWLEFLLYSSSVGAGPNRCPASSTKRLPAPLPQFFSWDWQELVTHVLSSRRPAHESPGSGPSPDVPASVSLYQDPP